MIADLREAIPTENFVNNLSDPIQLTGNPFVDAGLEVAAVYSKKPLVEKKKEEVTDFLSIADLNTTFGWLIDNIENLEALKYLSQFWQNSPFAGKNLGARSEYLLTLRSLQNTQSNTCKLPPQTEVV